MHLKSIFFAFSFLLVGALLAQNINVEGYVFEDGNRGYLNEAKVTIVDQETGLEKGIVDTDENGLFKTILPANREYVVFVEKDLFVKGVQEFSTAGKVEGDKIYLKFKMVRKPGYIFDVTLAEKRDNVDVVVDAIKGSLIEVYNNTKEKMLLSLPNHEDPAFKVHFEDGNHYTILIRKKGFFNKRMEAFVNVKGCILCFEGVGEVKPSDALSEGNTMGTLVANVELERIKMNQGMKLDNIYYDYAKYSLKPESEYELDKLINLLNNNPALIAELGSHTDSRGDDDYNYKLSGQRAQSAVDYVIINSAIDRSRIRAAGYGESTLVNKCKNGVACGEDLHAQNRRTELKIVGTLGIDPFSDKTLEDIIAAEKMDALLAEIMSAEAVRVDDGEEIPDEIRRELEKQAKEENAVLEEEVADASDEKMEEAMDDEPKPEEPESPSIVDTKLEEVAEIKEEIIDPPSTKVVVEEEELPIANGTQIKELPPPPPPHPAKVEPETIEPVAVESSPEITDIPSTPQPEVFTTQVGNSKIFEEIEVKVNPIYRRAARIEDDFSGYSVEFYKSATELPSSHEIFSRHGSIVLDQNRNGSYSYLLGTFEEEQDARDFLQNIILPRYPSAKVIQYKKGNRLSD